MKTYFLICFTAVCVFLLNSCAKNPVTGKQDFMLMSKQQELAMGKQSDPEIINFFGLYEDKRLQQFIQQKGTEMAAVSHRNNISYQFKIVDSPIVNAFAVPGGYVYFTRGIMAHFNNEAQFAGVLGHEIGHITARHSAKQYSQQMLAQVGLVAGMVISEEFRQFADVAQQGIGMLFLKFGRDHERQSDKLGVEYSTKIGYDAQEMAGFFNTLDRMSKMSGAEPVPSFLSTHPDPSNREQQVKKQAQNWKNKLNVNNLKVNRDSYLKMIDGMVYGEDPKQGYVDNNMFYHPVLRFQYPVPSGWLVQNTPQQVGMAPKDGRAMIILSLAKGNSLETAAQGLLKNNQLTLVESKQVNVNGLPAIAMVADQTQGQQTIRALIYIIKYGENLYNLLGVSQLSDFNSYMNTFNSVMTNFQELTDQGKINRQPERIKIKTVSQSGTLSQALKHFNVQSKRVEEVALLNGMNLGDRVEKGMLLKVIER